MNKFRRSLISILANNAPLGDVPFFHYVFNNAGGTYTSTGSNNYTLNFTRINDIIYNDDESITTNTNSNFSFPSSDYFPYSGYFNDVFGITQGKCQTFQFTFANSELVNTSDDFYLYYFTNIAGTTKLGKISVSDVNINGYTIPFANLYNLCNGFKNGKLTISFISGGSGLRVWWNNTKIIESLTHNNGTVAGSCEFYVSYKLHLKEIKTWFNFENLWDDEVLQRNV